MKVYCVHRTPFADEVLTGLQESGLIHSHHVYASSSLWFGRPQGYDYFNHSGYEDITLAEFVARFTEENP